MTPSPTPADVEAFRELVMQQAGLRFEDDKLAMLREVLAAGCARAKTDSVADYLRRVAPREEEIADLARALTVSETYFFRDHAQFRALDALLQARAAGPQRSLRMLSAGCSSGEEAHSLAIAALEALAEPAHWDISVLGVDLNPAVIERARAASYSAWSLRETPEPLREKYFVRDGATHSLAPEVRALVRFERENLVRPRGSFWRPEAFDVVFCRNLLMYLWPDAARTVVARLARSLAPGGHLFLGHAENLRGLSQDFHLVHEHESFYYERLGTLRGPGRSEHVRAGAPGHVPPAPVSFDGSWFEAISHASHRIAALSRGVEARPAEAARAFAAPAESPAAASPESSLSPALDLMKQERFQEALRLLADVDGSSVPLDALVLRAMLLVSTGELDDAEALCERILRTDDLHAGAHYILSLCREHRGDRDGSVEHGRTAAYLDADFAMPHLQLGRLARRAGDRATARRELVLALGLLAREDPARIVLFGGGFGREALEQICRGELSACGSDA